MTYGDIDLNDKTVLVTGAAGFVGSNLVRHIQHAHPKAKIVAFDSFHLGHFRNLRGFRGRFIAGDIASADDLKQLDGWRFDCIFHQAAISDTRVEDQARMVQVNTNAFRSILDIAADHGSAVVYASSAAVYGSSEAPNRVGYGETPETVYGFSKLMMEHVAADYAERLQGRIAGLRYFNVYGPGECFKSHTASMILQLGLQAIDEGVARLFKHGDQLRDFVYIEDVIQANLLCLDVRRPSVFNVGTGQARTFNDIVQGLQHALQRRIDVQYIDNPHAAYQSHTEADIEPIRNAVGYSPRFSLEEGIAAYQTEIASIAQSLKQNRLAA